MADPPSTRPSLLVRVRDHGDHEAWAQFVEVYGPLIYGFARKQGLQDADAADLMQDALRVISGALRGLEYDPQRGSFRGWLFTVVRHQLLRFRSRQNRPGRGTGDSSAQHRLLEVAVSEEHHAAQWDEEYERRQFAWAAEQVRKQVQPATWQAFWQTAVEGLAGQEVATALGMSVAAVYLAKSRVMARLKEQVRLLAGDEPQRS
jgi:RNA polymerase sigma-70 factor (ECF subfamily)